MGALQREVGRMYRGMRAQQREQQQSSGGGGGGGGPTWEDAFAKVGIQQSAVGAVVHGQSECLHTSSCILMHRCRGPKNPGAGGPTADNGSAAGPSRTVPGGYGGAGQQLCPSSQCRKRGWARCCAQWDASKVAVSSSRGSVGEG